MTSEPETTTSLPLTTKETTTEVPDHNPTTNAVLITEAPVTHVITSPTRPEISDTEIPTTEESATETFAPPVIPEVSLEVSTFPTPHEEQPVTETSFTVSFRETSPDIRSESRSESPLGSEIQKPMDQIVPLKDPEQHLFAGSEKEAKSLSTEFRNISSVSHTLETTTTIPSEINTTTEATKESSTDLTLKMSVSFETSEDSQVQQKDLPAIPESITTQEDPSFVTVTRSASKGTSDVNVRAVHITSKAQEANTAIPEHQTKTRENANVNAPVVELQVSQGIPVTDDEASHQRETTQTATRKVVVSVTEERRSDGGFPSPKAEHSILPSGGKTETFVQSPGEATLELPVTQKKAEQVLKKNCLFLIRKIYTFNTNILVLFCA